MSIQVDKTSSKVRKATKRQKIAIRDVRDVQMRLNQIVEYINTKDPRARPEAKSLVGDAADLYACIAAIGDKWDEED